MALILLLIICYASVMADGAAIIRVTTSSNGTPSTADVLQEPAGDFAVQHQGFISNEIDKYTPASDEKKSVAKLDMAYHLEPHLRSTRAIFTSPYNNCPEGYNHVTIANAHICVPKDSINQSVIASPDANEALKPIRRFKRAVTSTLNKCPANCKLIYFGKNHWCQCRNKRRHHHSATKSRKF